MATSLDIISVVSYIQVQLHTTYHICLTCFLAAPFIDRSNIPPPPPVRHFRDTQTPLNQSLKRKVMELEQRGKSAGSVAAERAEQVKELGLRAETAELLAAEREGQIKELEGRALGAEADAREQAKQVCVDAFSSGVFFF